MNVTNRNGNKLYCLKNMARIIIQTGGALYKTLLKLVVT